MSSSNFGGNEIKTIPKRLISDWTQTSGTQQSPLESPLSEVIKVRRVTLKCGLRGGRPQACPSTLPGSKPYLLVSTCHAGLQPSQQPLSEQTPMTWISHLCAPQNETVVSRETCRQQGSLVAGLYVCTSLFESGSYACTSLFESGLAFHFLLFLQHLSTFQLCSQVWL